MANAKIYTGQAGTGKTYSLVQQLKVDIPKREWKKHESVLALTFMHGSRKRLEASLQFLRRDCKLNCECTTIDSFAAALVSRFRTYLGIDKVIRPANEFSENAYECCLTLDVIKEKAVLLLTMDAVKNYIANSYPIVVVDEFQDCRGSLLEIVKLLTLATNILVASDPFQQLDDTENSDGMEWVESVGFDHIDLDATGVKRTSNCKILLTATSLRNGMLEAGDKIDVLPCSARGGSKFPLAEYYLKVKILSYLKYGNIAIITPTKNSRFVIRLLKSLEETYTFKKAPYKTIGPYNHLVGSDPVLNIDLLIKDIPKEEFTKETLSRLKETPHFIVRRCAERLIRRLSMRDCLTITYEEFKKTIHQTAHSYEHFYRSENRSKIIFTSVQGAKNREFDSVIVLWPYEISGNLLKKRKLLYNAVTRAKRSAVVIVQWETAEVSDLAADPLFALLIPAPEGETTKAATKKRKPSLAKKVARPK